MVTSWGRLLCEREGDVALHTILGGEEEKAVTVVRPGRKERWRPGERKKTVHADIVAVATLVNRLPITSFHERGPICAHW